MIFNYFLFPKEVRVGMVKTFLYLDTFLLVTITIYKKMILKNVGLLKRVIVYV